MQQLKNWKAYRAGGGITVNGVEVDSGDPRKVVNVIDIRVKDGEIVATDDEAQQFKLTLN